jgi:hypothetical protein
MELNDTPSKRSNNVKEIVDKDYKVERLKRLTCEALPVGHGKGLKWQGDNNVGNDDNSVVTEGSKDDIKLQPFITPVNHNTLTSAKAMQIAHTLMGNFCYGDKDKISQMEDMGKDACFLMEYRDKVCFK